jgi:hypothetical protein
MIVSSESVRTWKEAGRKEAVELGAPLLNVCCATLTLVVFLLCGAKVDEVIDIVTLAYAIRLRSE